MFGVLACERARREALSEPSVLATWWKSVAVEAEGLGCGGGTCVRGDVSWIRGSVVLSLATPYTAAEFVFLSVSRTEIHLERGVKRSTDPGSSLGGSTIVRLYA